MNSPAGATALARMTSVFCRSGPRGVPRDRSVPLADGKTKWSSTLVLKRTNRIMNRNVQHGRPRAVPVRLKPILSDPVRWFLCVPHFPCRRSRSLCGVAASEQTRIRSDIGPIREMDDQAIRSAEEAAIPPVRVRRPPVLATDGCRMRALELWSSGARPVRFSVSSVTVLRLSNAPTAIVAHAQSWRSG